MHSTETKAAKLTAFRLRDIAILWYERWEHARGPEAPPARLSEFSEAFLDHYLPLEIREVKVDQFLTVQQGNSSVRDYCLRFDSLARCTPSFFDSSSARIHRSQQQRGPGQARSLPQQCGDCGRAHHGRCHYGSWVCYTYGSIDHFKRDCPQGRPTGMTQPKGSIVGSSASVRPSGRGPQSSAGRGRGGGGAFGAGGAQNRIYALAGRQDVESSPDIMTDTLTICSYNVYALIDPGSNLSYVTLLIAGKFGIVLELLNEPFSVSTPVGEPAITRKIYRGCSVVVCGRQTIADLIELQMVDFDVIMGMDWLAFVYANVGCWTKTVTFHVPGEPVL
ncbi:uncharacterized protein LOC132612953 [Lycium barbarum]|uniref:uncharacterized protein LOC132612953 n=1 Tax=Lycium barbarum TaxID=112863 RepID=UPI00293EF218|nr:uncharacterized protein LOC132612953 [Lycium barbarum]